MQELYQSYLDTRWILHLNFCKSTCQISEIFLILDCMSVCKKNKKRYDQKKMLQMVFNELPVISRSTHCNYCYILFSINKKPHFL